MNKYELEDVIIYPGDVMGSVVSIFIEDPSYSSFYGKDELINDFKTSFLFDSFYDDYSNFNVKIGETTSKKLPSEIPLIASACNYKPKSILVTKYRPFKTRLIEDNIIQFYEVEPQINFINLKTYEYSLKPEYKAAKTGVKNLAVQIINNYINSNRKKSIDTFISKMIKNPIESRLKSEFQHFDYILAEPDFNKFIKEVTEHVYAKIADTFFLFTKEPIIDGTQLNVYAYDKKILKEE